MEELMSNAQPDGRPRIGRAPATTHGELSHLALALFLERGFEQTTVDDIVEAAGIGRRTFFRYFRSKNDLPWGDFDQLLRQMLRLCEELATALHDEFRRHLPDLLPRMIAVLAAAERSGEHPPGQPLELRSPELARGASTRSHGDRRSRFHTGPDSRL